MPDTRRSFLKQSIVSSGCANGTLTFCALSLMAAEEMEKGLNG